MVGRRAVARVQDRVHDRLGRWFMVVVLTYGAVVQLGLAMRDLDEPSALFWPASGAGAVLMVLSARGRRAMPVATAAGIAAVSLALDLYAGQGALTAVGLAVAGTVESVVAGAVFVALRRHRPQAAMAMPCLVVGAAVAAVSGAAVAVVILVPGVADPWWQVTVNWALPHFAGILVVGSLLLVPHRVDRRRRWEAAAELATLVAADAVAYWFTAGVPIAWLPLPVLIWSAMRLGTTWTAGGSALVALAAAFGTTHHRGPFGTAPHSFAEQLAGQAFSAVAVFTAMTMAAAVAEREQAARALALYDPLTGLANRRLLAEHAARLLGPRQRDGSIVALLYCDVNGFKAVNDSLGHAAGDRLLQSIAVRLEAAVRPADVVARIGGDEFAILCPDLRDADETEALRRRIESAIVDRFRVGELSLTTTITVGQAVTDGGSSLEQLLAEADREMYRRKPAVDRQGALLPGGGPAGGR